MWLYAVQLLALLLLANATGAIVLIQHLTGPLGIEPRGLPVRVGLPERIHIITESNRWKIKKNAGNGSGFVQSRGLLSLNLRGSYEHAGTMMFARVFALFVLFGALTLGHAGLLNSRVQELANEGPQVPMLGGSTAFQPDEASAELSYAKEELIKAENLNAADVKLVYATH